ncbi:PREDICTED: RIIa domain-containing protein 1-like [Priapulus caudatus]|uniref:RIIa domain-containing protein 1-like n=1 Tax=Priapulus caudatus TaxID=37621 RepID=A0ABM1F6V0_PRICU|nr:PREDICTED: RIIa domain-containing protein 1-like [Priapulus caudatus]
MTSLKMAESVVECVNQSYDSVADTVSSISAAHGMEDYDDGALNTQQKAKLKEFKVQTRLENEKYLSDHPEVEGMLANFLGEVLLKRPEDIRTFAADYFTNQDLPKIVKEHLQQKHAGHH